MGGEVERVEERTKQSNSIYQLKVIHLFNNKQTHTLNDSFF